MEWVSAKATLIEPKEASWRVKPSASNEDASTTSSKWKVKFPFEGSKSNEIKLGAVPSAVWRKAGCAFVFVPMDRALAAMSFTARG